MFGKLHDDLEQFEQLIADTRPDLIIGFALSNTSRQETLAINQFNKNRIETVGSDSYELVTLDGAPFPNSTRTTHSFCNWTMYKLAKNHKVAFYHIRESDADTFFNWLNQVTELE